MEGIIASTNVYSSFFFVSYYFIMNILIVNILQAFIVDSYFVLYVNAIQKGDKVEIWELMIKRSFEQLNISNKYNVEKVI